MGEEYIEDEKKSCPCPKWDDGEGSICVYALFMAISGSDRRRSGEHTYLMLPGSSGGGWFREVKVSPGRGG